MFQDGDGSLTFEEFVEWVADTSRQSADARKIIKLLKLQPTLLRVCGYVASTDALGILGPENALRKIFQQIATSSVFDTVVLLLILASGLILALDSPNASDELQDSLERCDIIFIVAFTLEMVIKNLAFGFYATQPSMVQIRTPDHMSSCMLSIASHLPGSMLRLGGFSIPPSKIEVVWAEQQIHAYWHSTWNRLDGSIVLLSWVTLVGSRVATTVDFKILRLARVLTRPLRLVTVFHSQYPDSY